MQKHASFLIIILFMFGLSATADKDEAGLWKSIKAGFREADSANADDVLEQAKNNIKKIEHHVKASVNKIKQDAISEINTIEQNLNLSLIHI